MTRIVVDISGTVSVTEIRYQPHDGRNLLTIPQIVTKIPAAILCIGHSFIGTVEFDISDTMINLSLRLQNCRLVTTEHRGTIEHLLN